MTTDNQLTIEELSNYFHLPINEVSQELGVCTTVLKKLCRSNGISRWPHRKIKSIDGMITALKELADTKPEDLDSLLQYIDTFQQKREYIIQHPNVPYKQVISKHTINLLNERGSHSVLPRAA